MQCQLLRINCHLLIGGRRCVAAFFVEHKACLHVRLYELICLVKYVQTFFDMYATAQYTGANGLARKQVVWDYIIATPAHARVSFNGRTDESGQAKPPPYDGLSIVTVCVPAMLTKATGDRDRFPTAYYLMSPGRGNNVSFCLNYAGQYLSSTLVRECDAFFQ
jgi:hypothetical protein